MKMRPFEKRFVNAMAHSQQVAEQIVRRLRHVPLRAGGTGLDVGCGNGLATLHVADTLGLHVVGVDVDPAQFELARRAAGNRPGVSFVTASATELPFETARFDIVSTN
jgi:ubiquinone/menaquinone biosynthesis C-methylase UbiE